MGIPEHSLAWQELAMHDTLAGRSRVQYEEPPHCKPHVRPTWSKELEESWLSGSGATPWTWLVCFFSSSVHYIIIIYIYMQMFIHMRR